MSNTPFQGRCDFLEGRELLDALSPSDLATLKSRKEEILAFPFPDDEKPWIEEIGPNQFKASLALNKGPFVLLYQTTLAGVVEFTQFRPLSRSERGLNWIKGLIDGSPGR